jgi:hypothetical protein
MTAHLTIALHNVMYTPNGPTAAMAAALVDVLPIEPREGTRLRGVVVPSGGNERTRVDVEAGRYMVQTMLPSGEMIDHEVTVADGATEDVLLRGSVTPHEWLGWQRFSTDLESFGLAGTQMSAPTVEVHDTSAWLDAVPVGGTPLLPAQDDQITGAFEIRDYPWQTRAVAVIRRASRVDAVVLPVPWGRYEQKTVQLAVPYDPERSVSVAIQDPELGPLLGFLSVGSLTSARKFLRQDSPQWRQFIELLAEKFENPFGAAVAGYVLLKTAREEGPQYWHPWLDNLRTHFPWIPDGSILCGWLALRRKDRAGAVALFGEAVQRGIPVLTGSLRMLHEGLLAIGDVASLQAVSGALARADVAQPFVTLRFDEETP